MIVACGSDNNDNPQASNPKPDKPSTVTEDVRMLTTTSNRAKDLSESWISFSSTDNMSPSTIRLNPEEKFQTIDGFGAAITGSTAYNLLKMKDSDRAHFLKRNFLSFRRIWHELH